MAQSQEQIQQQRQEQRLTQAVSQQQLLLAQLVELPLTQLVERIGMEMDDNPALETAGDNAEDDYDDYTAQDAQDYGNDSDGSDDYDSQREREERQSALDEALEGIGRDDEELPVYHGGSSSGEEREEMVYGETTSFYDQLKEQMALSDLDERESYIMEYLIGSLDDDGLLRKSLAQICEELAIYHNLDITEKELEQVLVKLQDFDPAGIGARSLQECLRLQIERNVESGHRKELMLRVVDEYFDEFTKKHWDRIKSALKLTELQAATLLQELRKLNPKPGASMGETVGRSMHQITPDFIIDTHDDGTITFTLNNTEVPELHVSQSFADSMKEFQQNRDNMSRQAKEALLYIKKKVDAAQNFIGAIKMRRRTLTLTMKAIIALQRQFFLDGDDASLRPMILRDVAEKTGLDLSTISRVSNSKYAQTRWGTFPLRHFFSDSYVTEQGEELSTRQIKAALQGLIESEDKSHPMNDEALMAALKEKGFPIARRTVAKYREQLGIPVARLRR